MTQTVSDGPTADRPLVTFVVLAYNQEQFVHEAIEGAFAQTYEPLEIILSDDHSPDRTFEIMQEMAAAYDGPHKIIVRRNDFNLGTALHVQSAFAETSGALFVVAAGDDISMPTRTAELVSAWQDAGSPPGVIHSGRETFDENNPGKTQVFPAKPLGEGGDVLKLFADSIWLPAAAPTCAYTREVFELFPPLYGGSIIEDIPLLLRSALVGQFVRYDRPLVRQRVHDNNSGMGYTLSKARQWNRFLQSKLIAFRNMQADLGQWDGSVDGALRATVEKKILAVIKSIPRLMLPESRQLNAAEKCRLALAFLVSPAIARALRHRASITLSFFGFRFHSRFKQYILQAVRKR